ncbi:MAG: tRNA pseudouridine(38-40) synthase TruA [Pseudomonadota bacterium]
MPRYALLVEYDGRPFSGWQRQADRPSVQGAIEAALAALEPDVPALAAAGRTDAGVHATGQVAQADLRKAWSPFRLAEALNFHLRPDPIAIRAAAQMPEDWHARFSAVERRYLYRVSTRRAPPVLLRGRVWHVPSGADGAGLDAGAMQAGADVLTGTHDFTTFRAAECQAESPVKTLDEARVTEVETEEGPELHFRFRARSFLHSQVRSFVGTLAQVGRGAWTPEDVRRALAARERAACGPVCPPQGLYLTGVRYPEDPFAPCA